MKKDNLKNISKNKKVGIISSLIMIFITTILAFDFMGVKSLVASKLGFLASGDVPAHTKSLTENGDGTYKLSLDVTGDAEKKQQKVNVIVIVDRSGSMDEDSGTTVETYTPSNDNGDPRYGLVDGKYVRLTRQGGWGNRTYWYNGVQYTGQRYIRTEADQNRMEATRSAVNNLAESLLSNNGKDGNPADTVEMALVSFATNARTDVSETTSYSTFSGAVNGLNPNGGTNWEAALQQANGINFGDNDPTYVIFFSDGAPTFHSSNGGYGNYNRDYGVYGSGYEQEPNMGRSYDQAKDDAATLATKVGKDKFYTIFAYGENYGATYMSNLTTAAGAPSTNNYSASNTVALQQAFAEILEKIEMAGIASVEIEDGTTEAVKIETTDENGLLVVDSNSFAYSVTLPIVDGKVKIRGQEATLSGNTLTWGDKSVTGTVEGNKFIYDWTEANDLTVIAPPPAEDQSGKVVWDLKDAGVLINEATYRVTFDAWPSQETYDLIADLKNGTKKYSDLPQNVKDYLGEDYKLKTNTTAKLSYNDTRNTNGKKEAEYVNPNPVSTNSSSISIKKEWENELDSRKDRPVTVSLNRDGSNFITINLDGEADDEWESKPWEATNITIATGLARLSDDGKLQILDNGHDYKFSELGSEAYNWELETETVHPMLINGSLKKLILVENTSEVPAGMGDKDYYDGYYKLANGKVYKDAGTSPSIKAINHRRSNLNIKKVVNGENANPNDTFEFTINVTQKDEKGQALPSTDTENYNDYLWFSVYGKDGNTRLTPTPNNWTEYQDPKTGEYYYHAPNGTDLVVQLKDGDNLRFTNLVSNTDFSVVEGNTTNYSLESITTPEGFTGEKDSKTITESSKTITGHIGENNTSYQIEYKNKNDVPETVNVPVEKIWDDVEDGVRPESVEVQLKADDEDYGDPVEIKVDANGKWKYTFEGLPKYSNGKVVEYTVSENTDKDNIKDHYETTIAGDMTTGYTITNKRNDDDKTVNVSVEKIWDDIDDGVQPTSVTVTLLANGEKATVSDAEVTIEADASGNWKYEWKELAKYIEGNEVTYSVSENTDKDNIKDHYDTSITGSMTEGYTIKNTRKDTDKTVNVKVEKVWDDIDDGVQPTSVTVTLLANGEKATVSDAEVTIEADASGNWKYEWKELAKYIEGQEVTYSVSENTDKVNIKDHYDTSITGSMTEGYTIKNTRKDTDKTVNVKVEKVWDDIDDGVQPTSVTVTLLANGEKATVSDAEVTIEADASGNWKYEWKELAKYIEGNEVTYSVSENTDKDNIKDHYDTSITGSMTEGYTIKNTRKDTDKTVNVKVEKVWDDIDDGVQPTSVTVTLLANGEKATVSDAEVTIEADASGNWKYEWKELAKYIEGQEVTYTVSENTDKDNIKDHYETTITGDMTTGYTIANKRNDDDKTVDVSGTKSWDDNNNQDGKRADIVVNLMKTVNGTKSRVDSQTVKLSGTMTYEWTELPKYENGVEIVYSVEEEPLAGYEASYDGYDILNTHIPETKDITIEKEWSDNNDQDGIRPATITVQLLENGTQIQELTLSAENNWKETVKDLPVYKDGAEITYSVTESPVDGYTPDINGLHIKNTHNVDKTSVCVTKEWKDDENRDGLRPEEIAVELLANGSPTGRTFTLNEGNGWTATVEDLDKNSDGEPIKYSFKENDVPEGYEVSYSSEEGINEGEFVVTNTHEIAKTKVEGKKTWSDNNNQDGKRTAIIVNLMKTVDGKTSKVSSQEVPLGDDMTYKFEDLPQFEGGKKIDYSVEEEPLAGYEASYDGYDILNTHIPETKDITIEKEWIDNDNQDGVRPATITVQLLENGTQIKELTLSAENGWKETVKGLPVYKDGDEITYSVTESSVDGYTPDINGLHIKNTHNVAKTSVCVTKEWKDDENRDGLRPEEIAVELLANGSPTGRTFTLNEGNEWSATVEDLDKNSEGSPIKYSFQEVSVPEGYGVTYSSEEGINEGEFVVTNTHEIAKTKVEGKKTWSDNDNQDGKRTSIIVNLMKTVDGKTSKVSSQEVPLGDDMTYKFDDLPQFEGGKEIKYSVEEEPVTGYEPTYEGYNILNTHEPEKTEVTVTKKWNNDNNVYGFETPSKVTVELVVNGEVLDDAVLEEANNWTHTFTDLDKYSEGSEIPYNVREVNSTELTDYTVSYGGSLADGYIITNTYEPTTHPVEAVKVWNDNLDQDGIRPDSIEITLIGKVGENTVYTSEPVVLSGDMNAEKWTHTFTDIPQYYLGETIDYSIEEKIDGEDYTGEHTKALEITNSYTPQTVNYTITKTWEDNDNQDGKRPGAITVYLYDGEELLQTVEISEANGWTYDFTGLPKYKNHGEPIDYRIVEKPVPEYTSEVIDENTEEMKDREVNVINTHIPERIMIVIEKAWDDENNKHTFRPANIEVVILANGKEFRRVTLSEENNWKYVADDLFKYENGELITYTVEEVSVEHYTTSYENKEYEFKIKNTVIAPPEITPPNTFVEVMNDESKEDVISLLALILIFISTLAFKKVNG